MKSYGTDYGGGTYKMEEDRGSCRGCDIYVDNFCNSISHFNRDDIKECPCRVCLIKGICQDACEAYDKFCEKLQKERRVTYGR